MEQRDLAVVGVPDPRRKVGAAGDGEIRLGLDAGGFRSGRQRHVRPGKVLARPSAQLVSAFVEAGHESDQRRPSELRWKPSVMFRPSSLMVS